MSIGPRPEGTEQRCEGVEVLRTSGAGPFWFESDGLRHRLISGEASGFALNVISEQTIPRSWFETSE